MAKAVINLQKESGGITKISSADGTGVTELVVPESGELVTKDYADLKVALAQFTGTNQSLTANGYQKLPGGLIIQWGTVVATSTSPLIFNLPISFTSQYFIGVVAQTNSMIGAYICDIVPASLSQIHITSNTAHVGYQYIVIGH